MVMGLLIWNDVKSIYVQCSMAPVDPGREKKKYARVQVMASQGNGWEKWERKGEREWETGKSREVKEVKGVLVKVRDIIFCVCVVLDLLSVFVCVHLKSVGNQKTYCDTEILFHTYWCGHLTYSRTRMDFNGNVNGQVGI